MSSCPLLVGLRLSLNEASIMASISEFSTFVCAKLPLLKVRLALIRLHVVPWLSSFFCNKMRRNPVRETTSVFGLQLRNRAKSHEQNDWPVILAPSPRRGTYPPGSFGRSVGMTDLTSELCVHETHRPFFGVFTDIFLFVNTRNRCVHGQMS